MSEDDNCDGPDVASCLPDAFATLPIGLLVQAVLRHTGFISQ